MAYATMADDFVPEIKEIEVNSNLPYSLGNHRNYLNNDNLDKITKAEEIGRLDLSKLGPQVAQVKLTFKDSSTKVVDIPITVIRPMGLNLSPVVKGEELDPLSRIKNIPKGSTVTVVAKQNFNILEKKYPFGKYNKENFNRITIKPPISNHILLRFTLEVVNPITVNFIFEAIDGSNLPKEVLDFKPDSIVVKQGDKVQSPILIKTEIIIGNEKWTFKGWDADEKIINSKDDATFKGYWEKKKIEEEDKKPEVEKTKEDKNNEDLHISSKNENVKTTKVKANYDFSQKFKDRSIKVLPLYVKGYEDGTFRPDKNMTRAEAIATIARIKNANINKSKEDSNWYDPYVSWALSEGLIKGYKDGSIKPEMEITRAEFLELIDWIYPKTNKEDSKSNIEIRDIKGHWQEKKIRYFLNENIVKGYPDLTFKPDNNITRAEVVTIINRVQNRKNYSNIKSKDLNYTDLSPSHWAYEEIILASIDLIK